MIKKRYYETTTGFTKDLNSGVISNDDIVFIKESGLIYTHGNFFGRSSGAGVTSTELETYNYVNWPQLNEFIADKQLLSAVDADKKYAIKGTEIFPGGTADLTNYYTKAEVENLIESAGARPTNNYLTQSDADSRYVKRSTQNYPDEPHVTEARVREIVEGMIGNLDEGYVFTAYANSGYTTVYKDGDDPITIKYTWSLKNSKNVEVTPTSLRSNLSNFNLLPTTKQVTETIPATVGVHTIILTAVVEGNTITTQFTVTVVNSTYTFTCRAENSTLSYNAGNNLTVPVIWVFKKNQLNAIPDTLSYTSDAGTNTTRLLETINVPILGTVGRHNITLTATKDGVTKTATVVVTVVSPTIDPTFYLGYSTALTPSQLLINNTDFLAVTSSTYRKSGYTISNPIANRYFWLKTPIKIDFENGGGIFTDKGHSYPVDGLIKYESQGDGFYYYRAGKPASAIDSLTYYIVEREDD